MADRDSKCEEQMSNAAEAARKRRDLRRKKILSSPEERMKKLMGLNGNVTDSNASLNSTDSQPSSYLTDIYETHSPARTRRVTQPTVEDENIATRRTVNWERGESQTSPDGFTAELELRHRSGGYVGGSEPNAQWGQPNVQWGRLAQDLLSNADGGFRAEDLFNPAGTRATNQQDQYQIAVVIQRFQQARYLLSLVLGILVRMSFLISLGEQYVQSILYPFLAFEICIVGYQKAVSMDLGQEAGGVWPFLLQLCGIQPHIVHTYKQTMGAMNSATEDLAVYLFGFIILHALTLCF